MFSSARGLDRAPRQRPSVAVNSSHLSPGLFFNCSALPAGSSLLPSSAALFSRRFSWISFCKNNRSESPRAGDHTRRRHLTGTETPALFHTLGFFFLNFSNLTPGSPFPPLFTGFNQAKCPPGFWVWVSGRRDSLCHWGSCGRTPQNHEFVASWRKRAQLPGSSFLISPFCLWGYYDQVFFFFFLQIKVLFF